MTLCYLDANATTFMPELVIKTMVKWTNKGNASSHYAKEPKKLLETFKTLLLQDLDLEDKFFVIFNSGASECNSHIITSAVRSFMNKTGHLPHVIISSIEHKSITMCCESLKEDGLCCYSIVDVQTDGSMYGMINPSDLEVLIKPNTCIISIMSANNETGIINNIPELAAVAHKRKIPFHTDCTQSFGKFKLYNGVDAASISFHKLYGPPGCGCLIIRKLFSEGYGLKALVHGTQNNNIRGGTENIPAIGASYAAYRYNFLKRNEKNIYLLEMKNYIKSLINSKIEC
jgi:cysteine desulfurase